MTADDYQRGAARTICPQDVAMERLTAFAACKTGLPGPSNVQLIHGLLGISAEVGELWTLVQKAVWYNTFKGTEAEFKHQVRLEIGDVMWYVAEVCSAMGISLGDVMAGNLEKLRVRYPEKYEGFLAAEENRDRAAEETVKSTFPDRESKIRAAKVALGVELPPRATPEQIRHYHTARNEAFARQYGSKSQDAVDSVFKPGDRVYFAGPHSHMTINDGVHLPLGTKGVIVDRPEWGCQAAPAHVWVEFGPNHILLLDKKLLGFTRDTIPETDAQEGE